MVCTISSNCRILQKSKTEIKEFQKTESEGFDKNSGSVISTNESSNLEAKNLDLDSDEKFNLFNLQYDPIFDANGNIVPLIFKHTINDKTEEIYLSGAKLTKENTENQTKLKESYTNISESKTINDTAFYVHTTYKSHTTFKNQLLEKEKEVKSFDFTWWVYFLLGIFITRELILFAQKFTVQSKLKSFITRVFNGKN